MTHTLDVAKELFNLLNTKQKSFILLKDDRNYIVNDTIIFQLLEERVELKMEVVYLEVEVPGLKNGHILLGLKEKENDY